LNAAAARSSKCFKSEKFRFIPAVFCPNHF
jgi:hypothetical protein